MGIPLVALMGRQPQINDYAQNIAQAQQIQAMKNQNALAPGQLQGQQNELQMQGLQIQQAKQDLADREAMSKAMQQWDGKDYNSLPDLLKKNGASFNAVMGTKTALIKQQSDLLGMNERQQALEKLKNDHFSQAIDNVASLPPEQQAEAFEAAKLDSIKKGWLDPQEAQGMAYQGPEQLQFLKKTLQGHASALDEAVKQAAAEKEKQQAALAQSEIPGKVAAGQIQQQEAAMTPQQRAQLKLLGEPAALEMKDWLDKHPGKGPADFMKYQKTLVPAFNLNMQMTGGGLGPAGAGGAGGGGAGSASTGAAPSAAPDINKVPLAIRNQVKEVLEYRGPMPPQSRNSAINTAVRQWVTTLDPTYDETTFPQRNKILTEYVKDAGTGEIGAINTALGHLGELNTAAQALSQKNLPILHSLASKYGLATGGDAESTYNMILHRVGPEMTKAYLKSGGTEGERGSNEDDFSINKGATQIRSNIAESAQLLNSKLASKRQNWDQTFKPASDAQSFDNRFVTSDAKATLTSLSGQAPTNKARANTPTKTISAAAIQKAAKDHGVSVEEATKQAKEAGYSIQ